MARIKTQNDIVKEEMGFVPRTVTEKLFLPGIESLHSSGAADTAETLANVLKSRKGITELKYVIGQYIEVTYLNDQPAS